MADQAPQRPIRPFFIFLGLVILGLAILAAISSGGKPESSAPSATATSGSVAYTPSWESSVPATTAVAPASVVAPSAPPIPKKAGEWEPIGKYGKKEIATVSAFIGTMWTHLNRMDDIEGQVSKSLRSGYRNLNEGVIQRAITGYFVDTIEENEKISNIEVPSIDNDQAEKYIRDSLSALQSASDIQKEKATILTKSLQQTSDSDNVATKIRVLDTKRFEAAFRFSAAYSAYESYGFTGRMVNSKTFRLKPNAKPDRDSSTQ